MDEIGMDEDVEMNRDATQRVVGFRRSIKSVILRVMVRPEGVEPPAY